MHFTNVVTSAGLLAVANAHVFMANPKPYASQDYSNGPLAPDGSNFPCKSTGSSTFSASGVSNNWELGSTQTLVTEGTAVHGGGSCQLSITYDTAPTKDSVWKVIHSVEGGCPSRGATGNLAGNSATAKNPDTYDFEVPSDLPAGDVVFAWTWLNRIGNREFYMNCAPVTLSGSGGSQSAYEALPDMVVLNTNGITDATPEGVDYQYADPGPSVEDNLGKYGWGSVICCDAGCGSDKCTAAPEQPSEPSQPSEPEPTPTPTPTSAPEPTTTGSVPGGVFITEAPTPTSAPSEPEPTSTSAPAEPQPTGGSGAQSGACSTEGEWNCIDGSTYQQCASGQWSVAMPVAAGTTCTVGQSSSLSIAAISKTKRVHARAFRV